MLEHNQVALEGLEKDLETAARLGQVRDDFLFLLYLCFFLRALNFLGRWITSFVTRSGCFSVPEIGWLRSPLFDTSFSIIP